MRRRVIVSSSDKEMEMERDDLSGAGVGPSERKAGTAQTAIKALPLSEMSQATRRGTLWWWTRTHPRRSPRGKRPL